MTHRKQTDRPTPPPLPTTLYPWIRCLTAPAEHLEWQDQEYLRLDFYCTQYAADQNRVATMAQLAAKAVQDAHGGSWCGVVRPDGQIPDNHPELERGEAKRWAEDHIKNGPESVGKRFLEGRCHTFGSATALGGAVKRNYPTKGE